MTQQDDAQLKLLQLECILAAKDREMALLRAQLAGDETASPSLDDTTELKRQIAALQQALAQQEHIDPDMPPLLPAGEATPPVSDTVTSSDPQTSAPYPAEQCFGTTTEQQQILWPAAAFIGTDSASLSQCAMHMTAALQILYHHMSQPSSSVQPPATHEASVDAEPQQPVAEAQPRVPSPQPAQRPPVASSTGTAPATPARAPRDASALPDSHPDAISPAHMDATLKALLRSTLQVRFGDGTKTEVQGGALLLPGLHTPLAQAALVAVSPCTTHLNSSYTQRFYTDMVSCCRPVTGSSSADSDGGPVGVGDLYLGLKPTLAVPILEFLQEAWSLGLYDCTRGTAVDRDALGLLAELQEDLRSRLTLNQCGLTYVERVLGRLGLKHLVYTPQLPCCSGWLQLDPAGAAGAEAEPSASSLLPSESDFQSSVLGASGGSVVPQMDRYLAQLSAVPHQSFYSPQPLHQVLQTAAAAAPAAGGGGGQQHRPGPGSMDLYRQLARLHAQDSGAM